MMYNCVVQKRNTTPKQPVCKDERVLVRNACGFNQNSLVLAANVPLDIGNIILNIDCFKKAAVNIRTSFTISTTAAINDLSLVLSRNCNGSTVPINRIPLAALTGNSVENFEIPICDCCPCCDCVTYTVSIVSASGIPATARASLPSVCLQAIVTDSDCSCHK